VRKKKIKYNPLIIACIGKISRGNNQEIYFKNISVNDFILIIPKRYLKDD